MVIHFETLKCAIQRPNNSKRNLISSPFWSLDVVQILNVKDHLLGLLFSRLSLVLSQLQVSPDHILQRFYVHLKPKVNVRL